MCGIAGIYNFDNRPVSLNILDQFSNILEHRGPDDKGFLVHDTHKKSLKRGRDPLKLGAGNLGLVHRRLSIVDLNETGWQPMMSNDDKIAVVYNGEIYNFVELAEELKGKGHSFDSSGDTAVLIAAYREWGVDCLSHFVGMFSFALMDFDKNRLFCARDFFGIKPFYYSCNNESFAFASEQKALIETNVTSRRINANLFRDYIAHGLQEGGMDSFYEDIHQLPPAHYLTLDLNKVGKSAINIHQYWTLEVSGDSQDTFEASAEKLKGLFLKSVPIHMRSDVPIAANLSGGIDSSSIVMAMRQHGRQDLDLHTISYIADYDHISEEKWIDIVNNEAQATPHKVMPKAADLADELNKLIYLQDEPFGSTSPYAQYKVFESINAEGLKVVLDGQGADELLAGYLSYIYPRVRSLMAGRRYLEALTLLKNAGLLTYGLKAFTPGGRIFNKLKSLLLKNNNVQDRASKFMNQDWLNTISDNEPRPDLMENSNPEQNLLHTLHATFTESSLPHLLRVADRNSMHFSVESRLPFLTPDIAEFIFTLPENYIIDNTALTKAVFRQSMKGLTPQTILDRRDKVGFSTPEREWLLSMDEWFSDIFSSSFAVNNPVINSKGIMQEWTDLKEGRAVFDWRFWRFINAVKWMEINKVEYS